MSEKIAFEAGSPKPPGKSDDEYMTRLT